MTFDSENQILYTADNLGYVKKWKISFQPEYTLNSIAIFRCHEDEITKMFLIGSKNIFITHGIDDCVRVWDNNSFKSIGFFSEESHWNIDDQSTWAKQNPFQKDPNHFQHMDGEEIDENELSLTRIITPSRSQRSNLQEELFPHQEEEEEPIFDSISFLTKINSYMDEEKIKKLYARPERENKDLLPPPEIAPIQMPSSIHGKETIFDVENALKGTSKNPPPVVVPKKRMKSPSLPIPRLPPPLIQPKYTKKRSFGVVSIVPIT